MTIRWKAIKHYFTVDLFLFSVLLSKGNFETFVSFGLNGTLGSKRVKYTKRRIDLLRKNNFLAINN